MSSSIRQNTRQPDRPEKPRTAVLIATRVLLAMVGVVGLAGTVYFSLVASPAEGGVDGTADWLVAAWSLVLTVGYLVAAMRLGTGGRPTYRLTVALVLVHLVFNAVKLIGYDETEVVAFFVADLVLLALLGALGRRPHPARSSVA